jgi:hypothetical protein
MIDPKDYSPLFLLAASLDGDLQRTAALAGVDAPSLRDVADQLGWEDRFDALRATRELEGLDAMTRELNRLSNLGQAQRARDLLDKALFHFAEAPIDKLTTVETEKSANYTARPLVDLVKALETVQSLTYRALGDTATERASDTNRLAPGRFAAAAASRAQTPGAALSDALDAPGARAGAKARFASVKANCSTNRKLGRKPETSAGDLAGVLDHAEASGDQQVAED